MGTCSRRSQDCLKPCVPDGGSYFLGEGPVVLDEIIGLEAEPITDFGIGEIADAVKQNLEDPQYHRCLGCAAARHLCAACLGRPTEIYCPELSRMQNQKSPTDPHCHAFGQPRFPQAAMIRKPYCKSEVADGHQPDRRFRAKAVFEDNEHGVRPRR